MMHSPKSLLPFVLITFLPLLTLASPPLNRRDSTPTTTLITTTTTPSSLPPPQINATILSPNGTDLTPSFKIMLYQPNRTTTTPLTSLDDRSLHPRQGEGSGSDPYYFYDPNYADPRYSDDPDPSPPFPSESSIITCGDLGNGRFIRSECDHSAGIPGSLQSYTYYCKRYVRRQGTGIGSTGGSWGSYGPEESGRGSCEEDEVCVNDWGSGKSGQVEVAWCVNVRQFVGYGVESGGDARGREINQLVVNLGGKRMSAVASEGDGRTPVELQTVDVEAGTGAGVVGSAGTVVRVGECESCVDLETQQFAAGTESLRLDAVVGSAGAVAAGVLWLVVLAG